eukprot:CAMPEP_0113880674 /NCGR_PEP_ID=MMETSP0780_2-20120614/7922_1 /TAXON_ID=652834 /ORGANISM="Palpitomonas bilix" /LENGTH=473 /DNA_ID=CAMNT_0000867387 /DNA_START=186 /DNA_END=1607 /DNA_ORIENTATION=+ /assembly_acc=CAM_ASM_000599
MRSSVAVLVILALYSSSVAAVGPLAGEVRKFESLGLTSAEACKIADCGEAAFLSGLPAEEAKARSKAVIGGRTSYSGFFTTNEEFNSNMFFWFFPSADGNKDAPVLLWLQGGPGGSSLFGLFVENGPLGVNKELKLTDRAVNWNSKYHVLYIDNPVGTGFSFTDSDEGYAKYETDVARDLYSALTQFFFVFSEYQGNDFYVTGESYAGHYVPAISYKIHEENQKGPGVFINLKGLGIGDGWCDPETMVPQYADIMFNMGLADENEAEFIRTGSEEIVGAMQTGDYLKAFHLWDALVNGDQTGFPPYFTNITGSSNYFNILRSDSPPEFVYYGQYLELAETRKNIHVGNITYGGGDKVEKMIEDDVMRSMKPLFPTLLANYKVLIYSGQLDVIIGATLSEAFLKSLEWDGRDKYLAAQKQVWKINPKDVEVAGFVREAGPLTQAIVRGAGHLVPYDQPDRGFDLLDRWITGRGY